jgi:hypothetical protein
MAVLNNGKVYLGDTLLSGGGAELPTLTNPGTASDLAQGKQLIGADGSVVEGGVVEHTLESGDLYKSVNRSDWTSEFDPEEGNYCLYRKTEFENDAIVRSGSYVNEYVWGSELGNATAADVVAGKTFTSAAGLLVEGTLITGGGFVYPEGAFAPVTSFTDGKQYALVAVIDGVLRYINTTTYNDYTMNATQITIAEDAGDYVIFSATPALFTAVASGDGFLLQNGSNYLHGTSSGGTALRVGTTQAVWTVDNSATGGFSDGKYYTKEVNDAVWLINTTGGYNWSIKYETAGSFGYDRDGRDSTYSTGFVSFVLCEYVAGEDAPSPIVDTSDATATAADMAKGATAYVNGRKITGNVTTSESLTTIYNSAVSVGSGNTLKLTSGISTPWLYKKGVELTTPLSNLGNATAADVAAGKTFTSTAGLKVTGTATSGGGSVVKTGTTTSATIATGLSSIEAFFIYKESVGETGLIHLSYSSSGTSYLYASAWTTNSWGSKTIANGTTAATVNGGSITIPGTSATNGALSSGKTYKWVAIGK